MAKCVFCQIAKKKLPAKIIYETSKVIAFLDINPVTRGHVLIIPKAHSVNIYDTPMYIYVEVMKVAKKIADSYKLQKVENINLIQSSGKFAQQDVFHFHIHLIPRYANDEQNFVFHSSSELKKQLPQIAREFKI